MDETMFINPATEDAAQLQLAIAQCLAEVAGIREQMGRDQIEIDGSRLRTRAMLNELKATLSSAGRKAA